MIIQSSNTRFVRIILAIQLALFGVIALDIIGLQTPLLRQVIGFIYLTFIPGMVIFRLIDIKTTSYTEQVLFSIGLSISFLMFLGLFVNTIYPYFGISKPLSLIPLMVTISVLVMFFLIIIYVRERKNTQRNIEINLKYDKYTYLCFLMVISTIFGVHFVNVYNNNYALIFLMVIISLVPLIVISDKLPKNLYPLAIFAISISLLYHTSLTSMYLWGRDIFNEYYIANIVIQNSVWNPAIQDNTNSVLSITILPAIYYHIGNISLIWTFKAIYPFIFSLSSLALYRIYKKQTSDKIAFIACFFLMSVYTYYAEMPQLARQEIAEFFLVILILLLVDDTLKPIERKGLIFIFIMALTFSHYGTVFLFLFSSIIVYLILYIIKFSKQYIYNYKIESNNLRTDTDLIGSNVIAFFIVFVLTWYAFISRQPFISIVMLIHRMISSIVNDFLSPMSTETVGIILKSEVITITIIKYLNFITIFFIAIGIITTLIRYDEKHINLKYYLYSVINFGFCIAAMIIPYFALALTTPRLYHLSLIFLAPFCLIGGIACFSGLFKIKNKNVLYAFAIFFGLFFLFNSGFVGEFTKEQTSISLSSNLDWPKYNLQEFTTANWLNNVRNKSIFMYGDTYRWVLLGGFDWERSIEIKKNKKLFTKKSYIFLGTKNVESGLMLVGGGRYSNGKDVEWQDIITNKHKVYDNAGAQIYYS